MSVQSEWLPASQEEPAEFELSYCNIKVQAICSPVTVGGDTSVRNTWPIQVRLATSFDTDWQESMFEEWLSDSYGGSDNDSVFEDLYSILKDLRDELTYGDERALLSAAINEIEQRNRGLIRG